MTGIFAPPAQLAPHLQQFRFWIWLQLIALRLYVRARMGPGVRFRCLIDCRGNVYLDYICRELPAPDAKPFGFELSIAYRAALSGDPGPVPPIPHCLQRHGCATADTGRRPCIRKGHGPVVLPVPDT